ncbi:hypothetical protein EPR50_G00078170 [Perca flavescens]|uniref:Uncharacterized protein n=1 Tax=Perca flavescens TaxID=8167 RepID=A0A484D5W0_PERFV|nr:hypothetical protein EPR50_G00078170 [Perca flavescens]
MLSGAEQDPASREYASLAKRRKLRRRTVAHPWWRESLVKLNKHPKRLKKFYFRHNEDHRWTSMKPEASQWKLEQKGLDCWTS